MNSKMTRIRTVLRYLTLGPMIAFGLLSILATGGEPAGGSPDCGSVTDIGPNSATNGTFSSGDCTLTGRPDDSGFVHQYRVTLPSNGGTLTIRMNSTEIDSFLVLLNSSLQLLLGDDDSGGGLNALINIDLSAGTYIIRASAGSGDTGAYTLRTFFVASPWTATSTTGAPDARRLHTAVWTGSEMIVWGGDNGSSAIAKNAGARFDPVTNTWTPITTVGVPSARSQHTAVWTGTEMIIWGGFSGASTFQALNDGAKYNPQTDTWTPITAVAAPSARFNNTAVWTGTEMIVWGGFSSSDSGISDGARYNPATDTWTPTSTTAAPSARGDHSAVWTGSKMIVWGGRNGLALSDTGDLYDPVSDSWLPTNLPGAPAPRSEHAAAWTGSAMIIFGGTIRVGSTNGFNTGGLYDPASDSWTPTNTVGAPVSTLSPGMPAVWTGTEMIIWGDGGGRYNPVTDSWSGIATFGAPSSRRRHSLVWTGSKMVVWGGDFTGVLNTGGIYDPRADPTP